MRGQGAREEGPGSIALKLTEAAGDAQRFTANACLSKAIDESHSTDAP